MKKCPYLSTRLECFAGGFGTLHCMTDHHENCEHKARHDKRTAS
ncbi:MAG: hypothetical protein V1900_01265 [Candidatus Aenigmatarchaeota archaeon]